jgi:hypothetical protein
MEIKVTLVENGPAGKLADVEVVFGVDDGLMAGLRLLGFAVWEGRSGRLVTMPARMYSVNGERRSFALLRPAGADASAHEPLRAAILDAVDVALSAPIAEVRS